MAEVIRWSTGEEMMNTTLERKTQAYLSRCLARLPSLHIHMLAHSTALIYTARDVPEWDGTTGVVLKQQKLFQYILDWFKTQGFIKWCF